MTHAINVPAITKTVNFTHKKADTFQHTFYVKDKSTGSAIDFGASATARMVFYISAESPSVVLELNTTNGRISLTTASGQIDVVGLAADMDVDWDSAEYEIQVTHDDGSVFTYFEGTFTTTDQKAI